ncbi:hypothetical protein FQR65_LT08987 [Abscondita terminalis]|nr:hypothetical protein FQR65_LT08987 [Abscondita terminalis]
MNPDSSIVESLDTLKIEEEKAIRNKAKKTIKKLERQKKRERLKIQKVGGNINIITQDFVDKFIGKPSVSNPTEISDNEINFPALGNNNRITKRAVENVSSVNNIASSSDKQVLSLGDFIVAKSEGISTLKKENAVIDTRYAGNSLDSDAPVRKRGKHREKSKQKRDSFLKREIKLDIAELIENKEEIGNLSLKDIRNVCKPTVIRKKEVAVEPVKNATISVFPTVKEFVDFGDQDEVEPEIDKEEEGIVPQFPQYYRFPEIIISDDVDQKATIFITRMVELQEKLYKRDSLKGKYKRRYVVGFHQTKKYLNINKAKFIIIATDLKLVKENDALTCAVREIIELCKKNEVLYLFALKRRKIGNLTLKHIPVSCVAILNYEGAEEQLNNMIVSTKFNTDEDGLNKILPEDAKD